MSDLNLQTLFRTLTEGNPLTAVQWQQLIDFTTQPYQQAQTAITLFYPEEALALAVQQQVAFIQAYYQEFEDFCHKELKFQQPIAEPLWNVWLPLAFGLKQKRDQHGNQQRLWIQGIVGLQGTGKTTLTCILSWILQKWGYHCLCLSLDDLYLPYSDRLALQQEIPYLIWRGPPGTHDVDLGLTLFKALRSQTGQTGIWVPRFDKSRHGGAGDRGEPESIEHPIDIVLFEGWFVGMGALTEPQAQQLQSPLAQYSNQQLHTYQPLWNQLDGLLVLHLSEVNCSKVWRRSAEENMRERQGSGMSAAAIDRFVDYFWQALPPEFFLERFSGLPCASEVMRATVGADRSLCAVGWMFRD